MKQKDEYLDQFSNMSLEELHNAAYKSLNNNDNYNYDDDEDIIHWKPVAKDVEFEKQLAKLKAMKKFNEGR